MINKLECVCIHVLMYIEERPLHSLNRDDTLFSHIFTEHLK